MRQKGRFFINIIIPTLFFGLITGSVTAAVIVLYKFCASYVFSFSEEIYAFVRSNLYLIPFILCALFLIAFVFSLIYKKYPNLKGGGIPTSISILRGLITFKWLRNLVGVFFMSLTSFLIGVPLGNEGPSVQMGTSIGRGAGRLFADKHREWDRYVMTGGACAGFTIATGAPISGIMFAIEEAHQRISPMIIMVAFSSVMFAIITSELLSPILGVNTALFQSFSVESLNIGEVWIPLVVGLSIGLLSVLFLRYYKLLNKFVRKTLKKVPSFVKIFVVFAITFAFGLWSYSFISTGHELIVDLFNGDYIVYMLVIILLFRATFTVIANNCGITGGLFLPIMALGAICSSLLAKLMIDCFGLSPEYYEVILLLGITSCISGMMKSPITAIVFAIEALSCINNILPVIIVSAVAFCITEMFGGKSINETVMDDRMADMNGGKEPIVIDTFVTVQKGAFAIGKQVRDIFWPSNLFVLSVRHRDHDAEVDEHGEKVIREGDLLHVRYSTYNGEAVKEELSFIVGKQDFDGKTAEIV